MQDEDTIEIDFSKVKKLFKRKKKKATEVGVVEEQPKKEDAEIEASEEISIDPKKALTFVKKHATTLLILIPIFLSIWFRAYPIYLPATDDWAENTINNNIKASIQQQIEQQYPTLPDANKQTEVEKRFQQVMEEQGDAIEAQKAQLSQQFKSRLKDDSGQTYLLAIDPWLAYGYANNRVKYGHWGNEITEKGESWYNLRNGREGQKAGFRLLPYMMVLNYKILNIFKETAVLTAAFLIPLILITLASAFTFIIGNWVGGVVTGLTASATLAIHAALLGRTAAGFSDTDNIITFF